MVLLLDFFNAAINLKTIPRQGWIDKLSIKNPESVAEHVFSMSVLGMVLSDSKKYDTEKILKMIILHDLAESITGDFTPEQKSKNEKMILENKAIKSIFSNLPKNLENQYRYLWDEYQKNKTKEAKFVHQIDKLEMALQAKTYSKQIKPAKDVSLFFNSAKSEIKDKNIIKLLDEMLEQ